LAENTRFAIALGGSPALIKAKRNEQDRTPQKIRAKGADVAEKKRSAACRSSSQYKWEDGQATGQSGEGTSDG
jgi:hypothetical protein